MPEDALQAALLRKRKLQPTPAPWDDPSLMPSPTPTPGPTPTPTPPPSTFLQEGAQGAYALTHPGARFREGGMPPLPTPTPTPTPGAGSQPPPGVWEAIMEAIVDRIRGKAKAAPPEATPTPPPNFTPSR